MAKDNRIIHRSVRLSQRAANGDVTATIFRDGMEDELAAVYTSEQGNRLIQNRTISGDWKFTGKAADKAAEDSAKEADAPKKAK